MEFFIDAETGELYVDVGGIEYRVADVAPELIAEIDVAGGLAELTDASLQILVVTGGYSERIRAAIGSQSPQGQGGAQADLADQQTDELGAPVWWTPEVARLLRATSWEGYLEEATRPEPGSERAVNQPSRQERLRDAIKIARDIAVGLGVPTQPEKEREADASFGSGPEAQQAAAAEGVVDAVLLRDPDTGRWTWDFPEMDPIARQVFTSEASAAAAAPPGFRPRAINSTTGVIWGFERIPEAAAPARRSFQQIIDDNIISGNFARAMELHGLRRMLEAEPEMLGLEAATQIATEFSTDAAEFRELFELLTREERSAAAIAPLQLGQFESRFAQLEASRAGVAGVDPFDPRFSPDIPEIFQPGGDIGKADPRALLFPDQPAVGAALAAGTAGPSAQQLALQRLGLGGRFDLRNVASLTTRAGTGATENAIFIEDILGVDAIPRESVEGLTFEQFREFSGLEENVGGVVFRTLREAAGLSGPAPTTADVQNLLGERREAAAGRELEAEALRETERLSAVEARKRHTGQRIFI